MTVASVWSKYMLPDTTPTGRPTAAQPSGPGQTGASGAIPFSEGADDERVSVGSVPLSTGQKFTGCCGCRALGGAPHQETGKPYATHSFEVNGFY
jgi:hypothetical protein